MSQASSACSPETFDARDQGSVTSSSAREHLFLLGGRKEEPACEPVEVAARGAAVSRRRLIVAALGGWSLAAVPLLPGRDCLFAGRRVIPLSGVAVAFAPLLIDQLIPGTPVEIRRMREAAFVYLDTYLLGWLPDGSDAPEGQARLAASRLDEAGKLSVQIEL